jgi:hypothetical protein
MNIDEMEAGRKLDILITDKVLEWRRVEGSGYMRQPRWMSPQGHVSIDLPRFSAYIDDAWLVVNRLLKIIPDLQSVEIKQLGEKAAFCRIWALLDGENSEQWDVLAEAGANTAPLAICRAALKAIAATPHPPQPGGGE